MPSLKIGCRVDIDGRGPAIIKDFDATKPKPWLLAVNGRMIWADHTEFRNPDHVVKQTTWNTAETSTQVSGRDPQFRRSALSHLRGVRWRLPFAAAGLLPR